LRRLGHDIAHSNHPVLGNFGDSNFLIKDSTEILDFQSSLAVNSSGLLRKTWILIRYPETTIISDKHTAQRLYAPIDSARSTVML
jgi:hypothetical protein